MCTHSHGLRHVDISLQNSLLQSIINKSREGVTLLLQQKASAGSNHFSPFLLMRFSENYHIIGEHLPAALWKELTSM